jgi:hypothetical protein
MGKSINAPMCAKFGYILGRPSATNKQNEATARDYAESCPAYGESRARRKPETPLTRVALPDPVARENLLPPLDSKLAVVRSCAQCVNHITDEAVQEATGWAGGACRATGRLILGNRKVVEAVGCKYRKPGAQRAVMDLTLLPAYVSVELDEAKMLARAADSIVEPLDYPTDKDVSPDEAEHGIQAWRKLTDPEDSGQFVMLPIFDPKSFSDDELELIPKTGSDEHPELYFDHNGALYQIAVLWMKMDETPAAWGQPGVGKTEVYRHLAWLMQLPFYRFSIKESTELYELEGVKEFDPEKGTYFRDGRFTRAWASRGVVVVDEPNMGRPEVWAFLRPCMDNSKQLVIDADGGRGIVRNVFAFLGLAMNPSWSPLNVGTSPIGLADASRLMHVDFGLPEEAVERKILRNRVRLDGWIVDDARLNLVMAVSTQVRDLCESGALSLSWGIRENIKVIRALGHFDPMRAYRMAAADYLEPNQRESFLDQVRAAYTPGSLPNVTLIASDEATDED